MATYPTFKAARNAMALDCGFDLKAAIEAGSIFLDGEEYVGRAADGREVRIGMVGEESEIELYLAAHPGPDSW